MNIKDVFIHSFTGKDNKTFDIARILWALGCLCFLGCTFYALYKGQTWDAVAFGTGFGALLAGGGAAIGMKKGSEPE
jgi:hypothetical protein